MSYVLVGADVDDEILETLPRRFVREDVLIETRITTTLIPSINSAASG